MPGLSPPTRGIPTSIPLRVRICRSIPAYAGDPRHHFGRVYYYGVYPRLRGGSYARRRVHASMPGLSPPTRGIRHQKLPAPNQYRSIPAYAGDPAGLFFLNLPSSVYPRLRGGSETSTSHRLTLRGLSPPTRGIHSHLILPLHEDRSIPAYAGDPRRSSAERFEVGVYPRLRGGSPCSGLMRSRLAGLSPPTRGIRMSSLALDACDRSIPAYAGDPRALSRPIRL